MDKNSVIGLVLIGLLLIAYTIYQKPDEATLARQQQIQDSIAALQQTAAASPSNLPVVDRDVLASDSNQFLAGDSADMAESNALATAKFGVLAPASFGKQQTVHIETDLLRIDFTNKGGMPSRAEMVYFTTYDSMPMVLFDEENSKMGYSFTYPSLGEFNTSDFFFTTDNSDIRIEGDEERSIVFTLTLPGNRQIENRFVIRGNSYDIAFASTMKGVEGIMTSPKLIWELNSRHNEKGIESERNNSTVFYKELDHGRDYLSETGDDQETIDDEDLQWLAFKQDFFSTILIGDAPFGQGAILESRPFPEENDSLVQYYFASIPLDVGPSGQAFSGKIYMGPNDYKLLRTYGNEIFKVINLGWGIFGWVNRYVVITIFDWLQTTGLSYGLIILVLTLVIKMILMPLTFKNYLSSAKMRVLKPEIEALNEKHKDAEPMKKQQATMDLYRKTGVSPFAGCIPMIIQLPILYAMFRFFPSSIQLRHEPFLWADDLSAYDSIASLPFTIPAYGDHVSLFTILMCISTLIYTIYNSNNMPTQTQPGMPNMKIIMYIFPFMMLFFFNKFASGLSYYYFLANVISILQMIVIKKFFIDEDKIKLQIAENKKKRAKQGKSRFQQKLEEMAKQRGLNTKI